MYFLVVRKEDKELGKVEFRFVIVNMSSCADPIKVTVQAIRFDRALSPTGHFRRNAIVELATVQISNILSFSYNLKD